MKGGAAGGGYAQVVPMEEINLHFTGDFHAITAANNLLAALIDNHVYWGNSLGIDPRRDYVAAVLDMNDRALRSIVGRLGGVANGFAREDGFDITVASEIMAVFCLATDLADLQQRLGKMIVGATRDGRRSRASDIKAAGAMAALLRDALAPNLVQTLEDNAGDRARRSLRQYRAWLQLGHRDRARAEAGRLRGDRGRLRRRSGRGEILRHQVPLGRPEARPAPWSSPPARAQDARRRPRKDAKAGECRGRGEGPRQSRPPRREPGKVRRAGAWSRSIISPPTRTPSSPRSKDCCERRVSRQSRRTIGPPAARARRHWRTP